MRKKILYIGNQSRSEQNPTTIDVLSKLLQDNYQVSTASSFSSKILRLLQMLWKTITYKCDFILIDTYSTQNFLYAYYVSLIARFLNKKFIPILHGGNLPEKIIKDKRVDFYLKGAYKIVCPSPYLRDFFAAKGFQNLYEIPNPIFVEKYPFTKKEMGFPKIFWLRAFDKIYNPILAIEVFRSVKEKFPQAELIMIGPNKDGSLEKCIILAEKYNLKVDFHDKLEKKEWIKLSQNYNVFINTSSVDNAPQSLIEAGLLGFPIISTNVGGIPYLIRDNIDGFLVNDDDSTVIAMSNKILSLFENLSNCDQVVYNFRSKFTTYDWEFSKQKWVNILE